LAEHTIYCDDSSEIFLLFEGIWKNTIDYRFISHKSIRQRSNFTIVMSNNSDIPCSVCHYWNTNAKSFSCNPRECRKLSEWLITRPRNNEEGQIQVTESQAQYLV